MGRFLLTEVLVDKVDLLEFPSPLEVWVGSYTTTTQPYHLATNVSVPSRGMGRFLQMNRLNIALSMGNVSVPSRGMGRFLPHILYPKRESTYKIVPTWKLS